MALQSSRAIRIAAASLLISGAALVGPIAASGASTGCGEFSFGFEGTRLLNDGISGSAGPFQIELPAGTYTVTTESFDDHAAHPGQFEQTAEQWFVVLDSGYVSPVTSDIPDDTNFVSDTFENQVIEASTAITVRHLGEGGVNSVSPLCVGFTTVTPVVEEAPVEEVVEETPVEVTTPAREIVSPQPVIPAESDEAVPQVEAPEATETVPVEEAGSSVAGIQIAGPPAPAEPSAEVTEVVNFGIDGVATPANAQISELALTGPSSQTWAAIGGGLTLLAAGGALLVAERRSLA